MASLEFGLFRAKFIRGVQSDWVYNLTPQKLFELAIAERPSLENEIYKWHIGNVERIGDHGGYFAIGRTTKSTIEKYDEGSGNFIAEELETSPYTYCVYDSALGFVAIARKSRLAATEYGIAKKLERLLAHAIIVREHGVEVQMRPIQDPRHFLELLASAYRVGVFTATFRGPNPVDADEIFQKPLAVYLSLANGSVGKTEIRGEDLDREVISEVARSTAATGNEASARVQLSKKSGMVTVSMKQKVLSRQYPQEDLNLEEVLEDFRGNYEKVRHD